MTFGEFVLFAGVWTCFGIVVGIVVAYLTFSARSGDMQKREDEAYNAGWEAGKSWHERGGWS